MRLLSFLVIGVLSAGVAELRELEPAGGSFFVFGGRVVPVLTGRALECDDFAHDLYYLLNPMTIPIPLGRSIPRTYSHRRRKKCV